MSITTSLAAQSAIMSANRAELDAIRANQAQQNLAFSPNGNLDSISRRETALEMQKERAKTQAQVARAQQKALKGKHKIDFSA